MGDKRLIDNEWITIDECYEKHKKFISLSAKKLSGKGRSLGLDQEDLRNVGVIGLMKAYERFDQSKGNKFLTLAGNFIYNEIRRTLRDYGKVVYFPRRSKDLAAKIIYNDYMDMDRQELADKFNESINEINAAFAYMGETPISFDYELTNSSDKGVTSLHELVGKPNDHTHLYVGDFTKELDATERSVLIMRLDDKTQREIGKVIGCSQVEVSRIMQRVKAKYKKFEGEIA